MVTIINNYNEIIELGRGSFGVAYKYQNILSGEIVCVKKLIKILAVSLI